MTYTITKPDNAQPLFGESRKWLCWRQDWCLAGTQEDTHFWDTVLSLQVPYMSISNVFPTLAGAKHLGPGSVSGSSLGSEYKSDPQGRNIRSWGHMLVSVSPTVFFPTFRIRGKGLLLTCPLKPQRVPSLIHLGLLHELSHGYIQIKTFSSISTEDSMSEFCNLSNCIHYTEDTTWLEEEVAAVCSRESKPQRRKAVPPPLLVFRE